MAGLISAIIFLSIIPPVEAQTVADCAVSRVTHTNSLQTSSADYQALMYVAGATCDTTNLDINSNESFTVECSRTVQGATPPNDPTSIVTYLYVDNIQFGNPGAAAEWQRTWTVAECNADTTVTVYCRIGGVVGGAAMAGGFRLVIRVISTTVGLTYDFNSDDGGNAGSGSLLNIQQSVLRCKPNPTTFVDGNPTTRPTPVYVGGDNLRIGITTDALNRGTNSVTPKITCSTNTVSGTTITPGTSSVTQDFLLKGSASTYPDDCLLKQVYDITGKFTITGFTTLPLYIWDDTTLPTGVTIDSAKLILTKNLINLDRTLTPTATCTWKISGADVIIMNRGETIDTNDCDWKNGRSVRPANAGLGRAYVNRVSLNNYADTTDFNSVDSTFTAQGHLAASLIAKTTATVTSNKQYRKGIEEYGSSRTSGELYNWGVTCSVAPCSIDVSATYTATDIVTSKDSSGSPLTRTFTIGEDSFYYYLDNLKNVRGGSLNGITITCLRLKPDGSTESTNNLGTTNANGDTAIATLNVIAPSGVWVIRCSASNNGNSLLQEISVSYISPFSGNVDWGVTIHTRNSDIEGHLIVNVTASPKIFDTAVDKPIELFPDGNVKATIYFWDSVDARYEVVADRLIMSQTNPAFLFVTFAVESDQLETDKPILVAVYGNLSAKPVLSMRYHNVQSVDIDEIKAAIEMNPYLIGMMFIMLAFVITFITRGVPFGQIVAIIVTLMGGFYALANISVAPKGGILYLVLLVVVSILYAISELMDWNKSRKNQA